jgi:8-oxo-dGTP diphosphatase
MITTPLLAVDGIVEIYDSQGKFQGITLIQRLNPPLGIALPGGFVDVGETVEHAVVREMKEELQLDVTILSLLGVYSDPARDPRGHTVSVVYICRATGMPQGSDDAKEAYLYPPEALPMEQLVFDHAQILRDYLTRRFGSLLS